jgi:hypothetical protein
MATQTARIVNGSALFDIHLANYLTMMITDIGGVSRLKQRRLICGVCVS